MAIIEGIQYFCSISFLSENMPLLKAQVRANEAQRILELSGLGKEHVVQIDLFLVCRRLSVRG